MYNMFATLGSIRSVRNDYAIAVHDNVDSFIDDRDAIKVRKLLTILLLTDHNNAVKQRFIRADREFVFCDGNSQHG